MSSRLPHASGGNQKSMSHKRTVANAEALSAIKLMNVNRTTALFLLILHLFRVTMNA